MHVMFNDISIANIKMVVTFYRYINYRNMIFSHYTKVDRQFKIYCLIAMAKQRLHVDLGRIVLLKMYAMLV